MPPITSVSSLIGSTRPMAPVVSDRWRAEDKRKRVGEAARVIQWLGIRPDMAVADSVAGSGYYTVRLAAAIGSRGRVLAQDIIPDYLARLQGCVTRAWLANVSVGLCELSDPRLPRRSADVAVMIPMCRGIEQPFALMANPPQLRPGARLSTIDVDDVAERHGTLQFLLECELAAVGYCSIAFD